MIVTSSLLAEWSSDPSLNSLIAGQNCNQEYAHITVGSDGYYYISRYQDTCDTLTWYSMHMNRLDMNGNHTWGNNGILVSDHPFDSWFSDHALITDPNNNAVLAFSDMRAGTGFRNVNAYLISPDSSFLWGANGVQLSSSLRDDFSPRAIVTDTGNYVFSWMRDYIYGDSLKSSIVMNKILPNGQQAWAQEIELFGPDTTYWRPYLVPSDGDNFINVWMRIYQTGIGIGREYHSYIYAQKFDTNGDPVWDSIATVCDLDSLATAVAYYQVPHVISDGNNGAFVAWYDSRLDHFTHQSYVQHILSDGSVAWQENGVLVADYNDHYQVDPSLCYYDAEQKLYVIWNDYYYDNITSSFRYGIAGQLLSDTADRLWGNNSVILQPYSELPCNGYSIPQAHITPGGDAVVVYQKDSLTIVPAKIDTIYSTFVKATRVNPSGDFVWNDEQVFLSDEPSWKLSCFSADYMNDQVVTIWTDNRSGTALTWPGDLYAQNVRGNGTLGPAISIDNPPNEQSTFQIYPNPVQNNLNIRYQVKKLEKTEFSLYNLKGQLVHHADQENANLGTFSYYIPTKDRSPGVYFIKIKNADYTEVRKVIILK